MERCGSLTNAKSDYCHNAKTVFIRKGAGCYISVTSVVPHEDVRSTISAYDTKANQDMFKQQSYLNLYQLSIDFANDLIKNYTTKENKSTAPNNNSASRLYPNLKEDTLYTGIKKIHERTIQFVEKVREFDNYKNMFDEKLHPTGRFQNSEYKEKAGMLAKEIIIDMLSIIENESTDPEVKNLIAEFKDEYANCISVKDFYKEMYRTIETVSTKHDDFMLFLCSQAETVVADSKRAKQRQLFTPKGMKLKIVKAFRILMCIIAVSVCLLSAAFYITPLWLLPITVGVTMSVVDISIIYTAVCLTTISIMAAVIIIKGAPEFIHEVDEELVRLVRYSITKKSFEVLNNILDEREVNGNPNINNNELRCFVMDLEKKSSEASSRISDHLELIRNNMNKLIDSTDDFNEINYQDEITKISKNIIEDLFEHLKYCCNNETIKNIISEREQKYKDNIDLQKFISDLIADVDLHNRINTDTTRKGKQIKNIINLTKKAREINSDLSTVQD
jgi:Ca2+-binding EF-hand superfamily protein